MRFAVTGGLGVGLAYILFRGFLLLVPWEAANAMAWLGSVWFGFLVNRRYTFAVRGRERRLRHAGLYMLGAVLQLGLSYLVYAVLFDRLHWAVTPAFLVVTAFTASFGFAFQSLVTFRRPTEAA